MRALRVIINKLEKGKKLPKLFEVTPDTENFLKTVSPVEGPFHDVSAGKFHGEYEHALQVGFIKDLYEYKHLYGSTKLNKPFSEMWKAMYNPEYEVTTEEGITLSLWDLVLDIRGSFVSKGKGGVRDLLKRGDGEEEGDPYKGTLGTSATVLHNLFGAYGEEEAYLAQTELSKGDLAKQYPHIAEAILNRHLKRVSETTTEGFVFNPLSEEEKQERKQKARDIVKTYGGELPHDWEPRASRKPPGLKGKPRENVRLIA